MKPHGFRSRPAEASTFLTAVWEIPNCRAIVDGLTPAMKAARPGRWVILGQRARYSRDRPDSQSG
jgi:hypothetical protein